MRKSTNKTIFISVDNANIQANWTPWGPSAQKMIKKGLAPNQQLNINGGYYLETLTGSGDPYINVIKGYFLPETSGKTLMRQLVSQLQLSLARGQRSTTLMDNHKSTRKKPTERTQHHHLTRGIHDPPPLHDYPESNHTKSRSIHTKAPTKHKENTPIESNTAMKMNPSGKTLRNMITVQQRITEYSNDIPYSNIPNNMTYMASQERGNNPLTSVIHLELVYRRTPNSTTHVNRACRPSFDLKIKYNSQKEKTNKRKTIASGLTRLHQSQHRHVHPNITGKDTHKHTWVHQHTRKTQQCTITSTLLTLPWGRTHNDVRKHYQQRTSRTIVDPSTGNTQDNDYLLKRSQDTTDSKQPPTSLACTICSLHTYQQSYLNVETHQQNSNTTHHHDKHKQKTTIPYSNILNNMTYMASQERGNNPLTSVIHLELVYRRTPNSTTPVNRACRPSFDLKTKYNPQKGKTNERKTIASGLSRLRQSQHRHFHPNITGKDTHNHTWVHQHTHKTQQCTSTSTLVTLPWGRTHNDIRKHTNNRHPEQS